MIYRGINSPRDPIKIQLRLTQKLCGLLVPWVSCHKGLDVYEDMVCHGEIIAGLSLINFFSPHPVFSSQEMRVFLFRDSFIMGRFKISLVESAILLMYFSSSFFFFCWECIKDGSQEGQPLVQNVPVFMQTGGLMSKNVLLNWFLTGETLPWVTYQNIRRTFHNLSLFYPWESSQKNLFSMLLFTDRQLSGWGPEIGIHNQDI